MKINEVYDIPLDENSKDDKSYENDNLNDVDVEEVSMGMEVARRG